MAGGGITDDVWCQRLRRAHPRLSDHAPKPKQLSRLDHGGSHLLAVGSDPGKPDLAILKQKQSITFEVADLLAGVAMPLPKHATPGLHLLLRHPPPHVEGAQETPPPLPAHGH